jgi:hypothetical protein
MLSNLTGHICIFNKNLNIFMVLVRCVRDMINGKGMKPLINVSIGEVCAGATKN